MIDVDESIPQELGDTPGWVVLYGIRKHAKKKKKSREAR